MLVNYLIRTNSIETDDRLLKTYHFLKLANVDAEVFAIIKSKSETNIHSVQKVLISRRIFSNWSAHTIKYIELLVRTSYYLALNRGIRWYANFDFIPLHVCTALFSRQSCRPIWDLHEMPPEFFSTNRYMRTIIRWLLNNSNIIVCNDSRRIALEKIFEVNLASALVIRNFPDSATISRIRLARIQHLSEVDGKHDMRTIVIVGGKVPGRFVEESLEVVDALREDYTDLKVLIVGGEAPCIDKTYISATGRISFDELVKELVKGGISLCFYDTSKLNNLLCEPNRFFQAMVSGQHVITFSHPSLIDFSYPLHHVISQEGFGDSLRRKIIDILNKDKDTDVNDWIDASSSNISFISQFPMFKQWLVGCYSDVYFQIN